MIKLSGMGAQRHQSPVITARLVHSENLWDAKEEDKNVWVVVPSWPHPSSMALSIWPLSPHPLPSVRAWAGLRAPLKVSQGGRP